MTYKRSRARRFFELQIDSSIRELRPLYRFAQDAGSGSATRLLAAYYVFAFAQFEVYIKGLVEDVLSTIETSNPAFEKWPDLMLAYFLHRIQNLGEVYRKFDTNDDEGALLNNVSTVAKNLASWSGGGTIPAAIDSAYFLEKKKYPSPKNMPQLFKRLGVRNIWALVSSAGRMNSEMILTSLNDLRTGIAHEGRVPVGFGMSDFRERIDQMLRFVAALDRGLSKHFCANVMSRSAWNGCML
jgi:hypothetical protein